MTDINLNQNTADCIKEVDNLGSTIYTNICSDHVNVVPWGSLGWVGFGVLCFMAALLLSIPASWAVASAMKSFGKGPFA